jgi:hypothetical protein
MTTECRNPLEPPAAARAKELAAVPAKPAARAARRPDLSAPFTVILMSGLMSAALFLSVVVRQDVPLRQVLYLTIEDPFGVIALVLLAACVVMTRIGDI